MSVRMQETQSHKILIVEDDERYRTLIEEILTPHYAVFIAKSGEDAHSQARQIMPHLILLDVRMLGIDGVSACNTLRQDPLTRDIPIIMITAANDLKTRLKAFSAGADDFLNKPFTEAELIARIQSKIRRIQERESTNQVILCGNLMIDLDKEEVSIEHQRIPLTCNEYKLLCFMVENKEKVQTRERILKKIWNDCTVTDRTVDTHMSALRRKLTQFDHTFESTYGRGYILKPSKDPIEPHLIQCARNLERR